MPTEDQLLPTPAGYATPDQLKVAREYAKALMFGNMQQPIHHWTQGLSNMVSALVGGNMAYRSGQQERGSKLYDANELPRVPGDTTESESVTKAPGQLAAKQPVEAEPPPGQPIGSTEPLKPNLVPTVPVKPGQQFAERTLAPPAYEGDFQVPQPSTSEKKDAVARLREGLEQRRAAMAFSGEPVPPAGQQPGAPSPMATALMGGSAAPPPMMPGTAKSTDISGAPGGVMIDPRLMPQRQPVTRQSFVNSIAGDYVPPNLKDFVANSYYGQNQPIELATTGGRVLASPKAPGVQQYIPNLITNTIKAPGGAEIPQQQYIMPGKNGLEVKTMPSAGGNAAPAGTKPSPADTPTIDLTPAEPTKVSKFAEDETPPAGLLAQLPPEITGGQSVKPGAAPKAGADGKTAQISSDSARTLQQLNDMGIDYEARKKLVDKDAESYQKSYDTAVDLSRKAQNGVDNIKLARELIEDPKFYSGAGNKIVLDVKKAAVALGLADPGAVAPNETFAKLISGNILDDMKVMLQGLGQVRVAEIDLLGRAAASAENTVPSNRAVLDLMLRAHQKAEDVGKIANLYAQGYRWDGAGKIIKDASGVPSVTNERPTKAGLDSAVSKYLTANRMPEELRKNYDQLFTKKPDIGKPAPVTTQSPKNPQRLRPGQTQQIQPQLPQGALGAEPPPNFK